MIYYVDLRDMPDDAFLSSNSVRSIPLHPETEDVLAQLGSDDCFLWPVHLPHDPSDEPHDFDTIDDAYSALLSTHNQEVYERRYDL